MRTYLKIRASYATFDNEPPSIERVQSDTSSGTELSFLRNECDCDWLEHVAVEVKGIKYDLWFDEEGKLRRKYNAAYPLIVGDDIIYDFLVGHVIVTRSDSDGNTLGLTDNECEIFEADFKEKLFCL